MEGNNISDWNQIDQLGTCTALSSLNIEGNPVARATEYRRFVVHHIPHLQTLNDEPVANNDRLEVDPAVLHEATRAALRASHGFHRPSAVGSSSAASASDTAPASASAATSSATVTNTAAGAGGALQEQEEHRLSEAIKRTSNNNRDGSPRSRSGSSRRPHSAGSPRTARAVAADASPGGGGSGGEYGQAATCGKLKLRADSRGAGCDRWQPGAGAQAAAA